MRGLAGRVTGNLRIGLMPTFTRAALAPTLDDFVPRHPDVRLHIVEGYSGVLTEMVLAEELDFAVVPAFEGQIGLRSRLLVRDREMLMSGPRRGLTPLAPVRLQRLPAAQDRGAGADNIRRRNLETYFQTHGVEVEAHDRDGRDDRHARIRRALGLGDRAAGPDLRSTTSAAASSWSIRSSSRRCYAEFVVIEPARRTLSTQARLFLERFEAEVAHIHGVWAEALAPKRARGGQAARVRKLAAPR